MINRMVAFFYPYQCSMHMNKTFKFCSHRTPHPQSLHTDSLLGDLKLFIFSRIAIKSKTSSGNGYKLSRVAFTGVVM